MRDNSRVPINDSKSFSSWEKISIMELDEFISSSQYKEASSQVACSEPKYRHPRSNASIHPLGQCSLDASDTARSKQTMIFMIFVDFLMLTLNTAKLL